MTKTKKTKSPKHAFFASCQPGLEFLLQTDLKEVQLGNLAPVPGGVAFTGDFAALYRANLRSRIALRILVRAATFRARHFNDLLAGAAAIPFTNFLHRDPEIPIHVTATCKKSRLYHSEAVAQRVAQSIEKAVAPFTSTSWQGAPPDAPHTLVMIRLERDICTISIDSSGDLLYKRGYKKWVGQAPLRENVAAAALQFAGYNGTVPLWDPTCGSGTIPIEGALMATGTAPGQQRLFSCDGWPVLKPAVCEQERLRSQNHRRSTAAPIFGTDIDPVAIKGAQNNTLLAQMGPHIQLTTQSLLEAAVPAQNGLIVCNPPWGKRLGQSAGAIPIYRRLGEIIRTNPNWHLCLICPEPALVRQTGLTFARTSPPIALGGTRLRFYSTN